MKNTLVLTIVGVVCLISGYLLGQSNTDNTVTQDIEATTNEPSFISVTKCQTQDTLACFGSGKETFTETENATILNLVSKDGVLRYGIVDKNTAELYEMVIE